MSGIEGGIDRNDPFYDCVLALYGQMPERMGSAVLIDPTHALSILHCFVHGKIVTQVTTALSRKNSTIKKITLQDRSEFDYEHGAYPHVDVEDECHDQIVLLELSPPLPGPFAQVSQLAADFDGTLRVACEDRWSSPLPHVRTARVATIGDICSGVLAVKEAQPGSGFPTESGAPAMTLLANGQLSVVGIQSGSDDKVKLGARPAQSRPSQKAYAAFVKVSSAIIDLIGRSRMAEAATRAARSELVRAGSTPASKSPGSGGEAAARLLAGASTADAAPASFRLVKDGQPHCDSCLYEIPDASAFDGVPWTFLGLGPHDIFVNGDAVTIKSQSKDAVQFSTTRTDTSGTTIQVNQLFKVGGIGGGRHWLYAEQDFTRDGTTRKFLLYLFRCTDDPETPDVPKRFRIEAFDSNGGNLSHLPDYCTVSPGCAWPSGGTLLVDFIRTLPAARVGLRQDDVGSGHEHT